MLDQRPPHPPKYPIVGNLLDFAKSPHDYLYYLYKTYGEIVLGDMAGRQVYLLTNPDAIQDVLVRKKNHFIKAERSRKNLSVFLGQGLLTSEGDYHSHQRKMVQPAFHATRIFAYADSMVDITENHAKAWDDGASRDIHRDMTAITMEIVSKTLFGNHVAEEAMQVGESMMMLQESANKGFTSVFRLPAWIKTPERERANLAREGINRVVLRFIRERRAAGSPDTGDLLSMLLLSEDENGQRMNEQEVRDEAVTLFSAGHETTSNALTWTFYLLSQNPEARAKLHEELDRVLEGRRPTLQDLKHLPYTEMVIKEAMRLYPPAWALVMRTIVKDIELLGYTLPVGHHVIVSPYTMHRNEAYWETPDAFIPERFTPENEAKMHKYQYFPFGGGTRICIGNSFAMMEAQLVLATIASRFQLTLLEGHSVTPKSLVTLLPAQGLKMRVNARVPERDLEKA